MFLDFFDLPFWGKEFFSNSVLEYSIALVLFLILFVVFKVVIVFVLHKLQKLTQKTSIGLDDLVIRMLQSISTSFYIFLAFWASANLLEIPSYLNTTLNVILTIWSVAVGIKAVGVFIDYIAESQMEKNGSAPMVGLLRQMTMGVFWLIGVLLILSNLGVNITSLIAGLGIGGVAVALAVQNVLGDLFSSFAIYFDKPFEVGDFIQVGQDSGTVKKVGIKTTRLQSLQGEEIIISNQELTTNRINNFKRLKSRNVIFSIGVLYETSQEKLEAIPELFKTIVEGIDQLTFNRAHLRRFDDSAITFELAYFVNDDDFVLYLDKQQEVLLTLNKVFAKEGIEFAYPTQTLYVKK